jgi:PAS domain S-box-containing protein
MPPFATTEILSESADASVVRGRREDGETVVFKRLADNAGPLAVQRFRHEFELLRQLDVAGVIKALAQEVSDDGQTMVLEDIGGTSLDRLLAPDRKLCVKDFLVLAIGLANTLAALHQRHVIHKAINPSHIVLNPDTGDFRLISFSGAKETVREYVSLSQSTGIEVDPTYAAPEQSGRMNRSVDHRADLYALGASFYRMLVGRPPFEAEDAMALVHQHIAVLPIPPNRIVPEIPAPLSAIILKLLAKNAEDRYQTTDGLKADLEHCATEWRERGGIAPFQLGLRDIPDRLLIPEKLYGRDAEVATLVAAFDRVVGGGKPELVLVCGYSGVGKSALVNELHKALVSQRGLFASGKFDQYKRGIPYATLAQAFAKLIRPLLGKSEAELALWRQTLQVALEPNGRLIVDLVPELALIIGEPPAVPELEPSQAKARFQFVFRHFVGVFARPEHPLVLFVDDLQWIDAATLDLLEDLLTQEDVRHLLLIGAYRDNEVGPEHPLVRKLAAIGQAGVAVREIKLNPLALDDMVQLIVESLHCEPSRAGELAYLLKEKTAGNPFFAIQFLSALAQESLVAFDHADGCWSWDLSRIKAKGYTDNVADLMADRVALLPLKTQDALQQLACLGTAAESATLARILGVTQDALHANLQEAVRQGFVQRRKGDYRFTHDRMQEAAYALIPEASRAAAHLKIGRLLVAQTPPEKKAEAVFEIVSQLNRGVALMESSDEREDLAELNLAAGRRAKAATAFASALTYLTTGAALLPDDAWQRRHELAFEFELVRAECEFLTGALTQAEQRLQMLSTRAASPLDHAAVTCLQEELFTTLGRSDRSVEVALDYLRRVGIDWSPHPARSEVEREYERIRERLLDHPIETLLDLAPMTDPLCRATMDVLTAVVAPALFTDQNLYCIVIGRMANLSLEHGNSAASCYAYALAGSVLGPHFSDYESGFRFGKLAIDLVEKRGLDRFKARIFMMVGAHIIPWTRPILTGRRVMRGAVETAKAAGDLTYAAFSGTHFVTHLLACGDPLADVQQEAEAGLAFARRAHFGLVADRMTAKLRLILTLRGQTSALGSFDGGGFEEAQFEQHLAGDSRLALAACWYWIRKLQARFFAGDYALAIEAAANAEQLLWTSATVFERAEFTFYAALARAALVDAAPSAERSRHLEVIAAFGHQLESWTKHCPENFENRAALVSAEIARIEDRPLDAMQLYEQAIKSAHANGFVHNEALACELAGRFLLSRGLDRIGLSQLRDARACYLLWGADGKVKQLDRLYPLAAPEARVAGAASGLAAGQLDLEAVIKASQAMSSQIELPKLMETLMTVALQNAGADRGLLILTDDGGFAVEVEAEAASAGIDIRMTQAAVAQAVYPQALINYVIRTRQSVIVDDSSRPDPTFDEAYIKSGQARSIFALPLLQQGKLTGVLYLENTQTSHAFTADRVAVLEVLGGQAAISLESARIYAYLRESEAKYRRIVDTAYEGIMQLAADGVITFVNARMAEMVGYTAQEMIGQPASAFLFKEDLPVHAERMEKRRRAVAELYESRILRKDGETLWVLASAAPIFDDKHLLQGSFAMVTDITKRKLAEEELRRHKDHLENKVQQRTADLVKARNAAEAANRAKSVFLSNMSHELRTPLNAILGFSTLVRQNPVLPESLWSNLDIINRSGEHLLALINDVLEMSKIEAGRIQLVVAPFDLGCMVREVKDMMQVRAEEKGLLLQIDQDSRFPRYVVGDEARLRQVLINLIGNAIKFTAQGGVTLRLGTRQNAIAHLLIEIEDTGTGIAPQDQQRIFEPFVQLGDQGASKGTGLGLAITRQFVQMMGGHIDLQSEVSKGSLFRIDLPLNEARETDIVAALNQVQGEVVGLAPGQPSYRILIVEDQFDNQMLLLRLMETLGLDVRVVANGEEAVRLFQHWHPNLIWMDRRMPVMDGLEATRRIRKLPGGQKVKIIAVTASAFRDEQQETLAAGMDDFVSKPYHFGDIYDCLGRHLGLKYVYRSAPTAAQLTAGEPIRVLIVDDDDISRFLTSELLNKSNFVLRDVASGPEALDIFGQWQPHLILMDMRMPGMDGAETTRRLRTLPGGDKVLIVALTAGALDEQCAEFIAAGCNEVAIKPVDLNKVQKLLAQHLGSQGADSHG